MRELTMVREVWAFLRTRKKFWLLPLVVSLLALALLLTLTAGSALAPFIYTMF
jgi:hypothetical protein